MQKLVKELRQQFSDESTAGPGTQSTPVSSILYFFRSAASLETHIKKLNSEYDKLNEEYGRGQIQGYSVASAAHVFWVDDLIRWWKTANEKMNAATLVSEAQAHLNTADLRCSQAASEENKVRRSPEMMRTRTQPLAEEVQAVLRRASRTAKGPANEENQEQGAEGAGTAA